MGSRIRLMGRIAMQADTKERAARLGRRIAAVRNLRCLRQADLAELIDRRGTT